jgi:hypothetical protein
LGDLLAQPCPHGPRIQRIDSRQPQSLCLCFWGPMEEAGTDSSSSFRLQLASPSPMAPKASLKRPCLFHYFPILRRTRGSHVETIYVVSDEYHGRAELLLGITQSFRNQANGTHTKWTFGHNHKRAQTASAERLKGETSDHGFDSCIRV